MKNKQSKYYSIDKISGSIFSEDKIVQEYNSKRALEKSIGKKVIRATGNYGADYSVVQCNQEGKLYRDRRKWNYYKIIN